MTTMDAADSSTSQRPRGAKLGAWALGLAILPFVYLAVLFMLVLIGLGERGNGVAVVPAVF
jgi:hypothetical protein